MYVLITCIRFHDQSRVAPAMEALRQARSAIPAITAQLLEPPVNTRPGDPQIFWRICFDREDDFHATVIDPAWTARVAPHLASGTGVEVESIFYRRTIFAAPHPDITDGIWRALIFAVRDGVDATNRTRFETEMQMMPAYVGTIRNWALNPVLWSSGSRRWSYVWEQDYDDLDGLLGEYMKHLIHMGLIDKWFDPEHPEHIFDARRLRMVCPSPASAIAPPGTGD